MIWYTRPTTSPLPSYQWCGEQDLDTKKGTHKHDACFRENVVFFSILTHERPDVISTDDRVLETIAASRKSSLAVLSGRTRRIRPQRTVCHRPLLLGYTAESWSIYGDSIGRGKSSHLINYVPLSTLLLFGRSRMIVGHHRLTDELFPAAAIFCSPYAL